MGFLLTNSTTKNKMTNDIIVKNSYNVDVEVKDIYYTQHRYNSTPYFIPPSIVPTAHMSTLYE